MKLSTVMVLLTLLGVANESGATSYLQPGRYYVTPASPVRWLHADRSTILVSDKRSVIAAIDRNNGGLRWTHHPSGGRVDSLALSDDEMSVVVSGVDLEVLNTRTGTMRWAMRLNCRSPCEHRVRAVANNAILVSGGGPVHRWLWRYDIATGRPAWSAPLPIGHPRSFVIDGPSGAFLLEANAPFAVRRLNLAGAQTVSRHAWRSEIGEVAGSELTSTGDGRAVLTGPYPGGGMPPMAIVEKRNGWRPRALPLSGGGMAGRRVSKIVSHGRLIAALARGRQGTSNVVTWGLDAPTRPIWRSANIQHATLLPLETGRSRHLVVVLNEAHEAHVIGFDATSSSRTFHLRLPCSRRCRALDAGQGNVMIVENHHDHGAIALINAANGAIEAVGALDRTHISSVARSSFSGAMLAVGGGVATSLKVPLERAQADLSGAKTDGEEREAKALERALGWASPAREDTATTDKTPTPSPEPSTATPTTSGRIDGRTLARTIRQSPPRMRLERLAHGLERLSRAGLEIASMALNALVMVTAEVSLDTDVEVSDQRWRKLVSSTERLVSRHGENILGQPGRRQEPAMRALVVMSAVASIVRRDDASALRVLRRWLALPSIREPGVEFIAGIAAREVLIDLFEQHSEGLQSSNDGIRHAAARALAAFRSTALALGSERWLTERTRPILEGTRPESRRAARALTDELRAVATRFKRERGAGGVGGPGCALVCRVLRDGCDNDCHADCKRRYRRCLNTCKRRRLPKVSLQNDRCR